MRIFRVEAGRVIEHAELPPLSEPASAFAGYLWLSLSREELRQRLPQVQDIVNALSGTPLVDLHISDLLNEQLPSRYDFTSQYDVMVFRRLAVAPEALAQTDVTPGASFMLRPIETSPVGFAVFDRLLVSVHPEDPTQRDAYVDRLMKARHSGVAPAEFDIRSLSARLPSTPADMMLRMLSQIVDGYLELRRELTRQLDLWQTELLDPRNRTVNWTALMQARQSLHHLDEICEDQQGAVQDWIDARETEPPAQDAAQRREQELIMVRSRDVLEHIERVVRHVQRLEQNAETAVQMHFSVQGHRTNDIMRVLTVLTAVFLPLNLIAGIFGMNFEFIPLVHKADGFWIAMGVMATMAVGLTAFFWRKRYLARTR